ncbi:MAG: hypothetical protein Q9164_006520 [Protoblastenia rupestris]
MANIFTKRTTSPLHFESASYSLEDVIWPGSEEEEGLEERCSKKRRRVEVSGTQYLDGRGLFIQTAGLRGPFEKGWVNPWATSPGSYSLKNIRRYPKLTKDAAASHGQQHFPMKEPVAVKRRSIADDRPNILGRGITDGAISSEPSAKRKRHGEPDRVNMHSKSKSKSPGYALESGKREWLKKTSPTKQARFQTCKSPTPTPAPRDRSRPISSPPRKEESSNVVTPTRDVIRYGRGSVDQYQPNSMRLVTTPATARKNSPLKAESPHNGNVALIREMEPQVKEISLIESLDHVRQGYEEVKRLSREAVWSAEKSNGHLQFRETSQEAALNAQEEAGEGFPSRLEPYVSGPTIAEKSSHVVEKKATSRPTKPSPRAIPPSTYQPGFEYCAAKRTSPTSSRGSLPFVEAPERTNASSSAYSGSSSDSESHRESEAAARRKITRASSPVISPGNKQGKVTARVEATRRLTFTASGRPKIAGTRPLSRSGLNISDDRDPFVNNINEQVEQKIPPVHTDVPATKTSTKSSNKSLTIGNPSKTSINALPEAQVVPEEPHPPAQVISGPSTNLLETDKESPKLPVFDEEDDSYMNLSTQAALLKAQRSWKDEVLAGLKQPSPMPNGFAKAIKTPQSNGHRRASKNDVQYASKSPDVDNEGPMSTQAMIDEISPFAITTIKKRPPSLKKRTGLAPTPTKAKASTSTTIISPTGSAPFPTYSPNMSTSPDISQPHKSPAISHAHPNPTPTLKPPTSSTLTSFSILPNGTLTETSVLQDGQKPQQPALAHEESYTSLPDLDFGKPFGSGNGSNGAAVKGNGSSGNGVKTNGSAKPSGQMELDAAIEDAGSFLGEWDVEVEARRVGTSTHKHANGSAKKEGLGKSILSRRKAKV